MFDIAPTELLIVALVALVVIGPKDLPNVLRTVGNWVGRARGMARHFRSGIDTMIRESELEEMEKKWKSENERIMSEHPMLPHDPTVPQEQALPSEPYGEQDAPPPEAPPGPIEPHQDRRELP
jgi:sec-independent protein translocase protein TatB